MEQHKEERGRRRVKQGRVASNKMDKTIVVVTETRVPPALKTPDIEHDVAAFIATLTLGPPVVTGTTIMLDGGNHMSV